MTGWRSRIVGSGEVAAGELAGMAHPQNWRKHPDAQGKALQGALDQVGWVQEVIVNRTTGRMLDGHLRVELARQQGDATLIPVKWVELTEDEERAVLATLDPIGAMAVADEETLLALVHSVDDADLKALMLDMHSVPEPTEDEWGGAFGRLPSGDRKTLQEMLFTLTNEQAEQIKAALDEAKKAGPFVDTGNENSNGNALARICETYLTDGR